MSWEQHSSVQIYRAVDLGFSPDPTYCVWIAHLGNRYIVFKEKLWLRTVAVDIAKSIVEESRGMKVAMTYADPTMFIQTAADVRSIADKFEDNGVPMEASINNREHYAHAVHSALQEEVTIGENRDGSELKVPKLQILDKGSGGLGTGCPYLIKTIPQMRYDPKHPLRMADSKNDHGVISLAYFLISSGATERRATHTLSRLPKWMRPRPKEKHSFDY